MKIGAELAESICVKRLGPATADPISDQPHGENLSNRILFDFLNDRPKEDSNQR